MDKERSGVPEGARGGVCCSGRISLEEGREMAKGQKTLGPELKRHKKQGLFRGTAGGRLGDEKTGARGRSAREAH